MCTWRNPPKTDTLCGPEDHPDRRDATLDSVWVSKLAPASTPAQFGQLADVPPALEWLANITNPKTRRACKNDVSEFFAFAGLKGSAEVRTVTRAHVIAWRKDLEGRQLADTSIRRKLSALSSLFDYLCERNAVLGNPVNGVKRPTANGNQGSTPALGDAQARKLLDAPPENTLKGKRDRAILATLLYHGIRREELCRLRVKDMQSRQGVGHFRIKASATKCGSFPSTPRRNGSSKNIWLSPVTARTSAGPSSGRSRTIALRRVWTGRSIRPLSTEIL